MVAVLRSSAVVIGRWLIVVVGKLIVIWLIVIGGLASTKKSETCLSDYAFKILL